MAQSKRKDCLTFKDEDVHIKPIRSFHQKLRHLMEVGDSLSRIQEHVLGKGNTEIPVYPRTICEDLRTTYELLQTRLKEAKLNGLAYVGTSLAATCNISVATRPPQHELTMDVCLFVKDRAAYVISITKTSHHKVVERYNLLLATGIIESVRRFTDVKFSALYGIMALQELETLDAFEKALSRIKMKSQKMSIASSLSMSEEKHKKVVKSFLSSIATTNAGYYPSVVDPCATWVLTLEQFCLLSENIDKKDQQVSKPSSGSIVLLFEVAQRLEKAAPTMLLLYSEEEAEWARKENLCTKMLTYQEFHKELENDSEAFHNIYNVVTNTTLERVPENFGRVWYIFDSKDSGTEESTELLNLTERAQEDIMKNTHQMFTPPVMRHIMKRFGDGQKWITITGVVGSGKTTLGYMVLKEMKNKDFDVFVVNTPAEYHIVTESKRKSVVMMNNVLGTYKLDKHALKQWQQIINHHLTMSDHCKIHVLFLCNKIILQEATFAGILYESVTDAEMPFDLCSREWMSKEVKLEMLNYLLKVHGIEADDSFKEQVCSQADTTHGFLHCCNMYISLKTKQLLDDDKMVLFFQQPLDYTKEIIKMHVFQIKENTLLKDIVERGGKMRIPEDAAGRKALNSLINGFLLKSDGDGVTFSHQSLLPQVTVALCERDPSFLVQNCIFPNFVEHLRVERQRQECTGNEDVIFIPTGKWKDVVQRMAEEITSKHFSIMENEVFKDTLFCEDVVRTVIVKKQETGFDVNTRNENGETLLHVAAMYQCNTAVEVLLEYNADVTAVSKKLQTAIHTLCQGYEVDTSILLKLIENGTPTNAQDKYGKTALHYLCDRQKIDSKAMCLLIENEADVTITDYFERMPLHAACKAATNLSDIKLEGLIGHKDNASLGDRNGMTPLHHLCDRDIIPLDAIKDLISIGADVNANDSYCMSPFHYICKNEKADLEVINVFIENHASLSGTIYGTPLHFFCERSRVELTAMEVLLRNVADVNKSNKQGKRALHLLCERFPKSNAKALACILNHGADVILTDATDSSALHYVTSNDDTDAETVKLILNHGAKSEVNRMNMNKETALHLLVQQKTVDRNTVHALLDCGADVNLQGPRYNSPFHTLCQKKVVDIDILHLLSHTCKVNMPGELNRTPLHMLCAREHVQEDAIALLVDKGADTNLTDVMGLMPLHYLCMSSSAVGSVKRCITDKNINFSLFRDTEWDDNKGQTALHLACITINASLSIVKELLSSKAYIFATDSRGRTPLHFLCQQPRKYEFSESVSELTSTLVRDQQPYDEKVTQDRHDIAIYLLSKRHGRQRGTVKSTPKTSDYSTDSSTDGTPTRQKEAVVINKEYCNITDNHGRTALHYLCMGLPPAFDDGLYKNLLKGSNVEKFDCFGMTVLHYLILKGAYTRIELLLDCKKDVANIPVGNTDAKHERSYIVSGMTPLHLACITSNADVEVVQILLKNAADVNMLDIHGRKPLDYICEDPYCFVVNYKTEKLSIDHTFDRKQTQDQRCKIKSLLFRGSV